MQCHNKNFGQDFEYNYTSTNTVLTHDTPCSQSAYVAAKECMLQFVSVVTLFRCSITYLMQKSAIIMVVFAVAF